MATTDDAPRDDRPETPGSQAWHLFWELSKNNRAYLESVATEFDLTPQTMYALKFLGCDESPLPMNELAAMLTCDASSVTVVADRLEGRGLVERRSAPNDRRVKALVLTPEGLTTQARIFERMKTPPAHFANLPLDDQIVLRDILAKMIALADPMAEVPSPPFEPGRQPSAEVPPGTPSPATDALNATRFAEPVRRRRLRG